MVHEDMTDIDPEVAMDHLNVDPRVRPVKQKKRHFALEKNQIIEEEAQKLLEAGQIMEI